MNKHELAKLIWNSAQNMRGSIEASKYKDYIFGFMFYKFLSEKEQKYLKELGMPDSELVNLTKDDMELVEDIQNKIGYFIEYKDLFSTWYNKGIDFTIDDVRTGIDNFNENINQRNKNMKRVYTGILDTMRSNLKDLGTTDAEQSKVARELVKTINKIPMDGREDYDVLGYVYEYLLSNFAAGAGKKAGEFYSPAAISAVISDVIANHHKDKEEISVYDMAAGSSSLLISVGKAVSKHMHNPNGVKYYAQELITDTYNLARMNLIMKDVLPDNIVIRNGNTLADDWPFFEDDDKDATYNPVWVDAIAANPPYSALWNPEGAEYDPRFRYGIAPKSKADYAFLQHGLYHLNDGGIMGIVLPHGVLFRGGEEETIRRNLIENHHISAIVGLPAGIFYGTGIPTIIMFLRKNRFGSDILIVDASKGFKKEGKQNVLRERDIKKIVDTVNNRIEIPSYSRVVSLDEIKKNEYNLNIPRYVDSSEKSETYDIYATLFGGVPKQEINQLSDFWSVFPNLKNDIFTSGEYSKLNNNLTPEKLSEYIFNHDDIQKFIHNFHFHFASFDDFLINELINNIENLHINSEENRIADEIFKRVEGLPLIDKYEVYQILADKWPVIAEDIETIQTEGMSAVRQVDANMVLKKKNSKDIEVQEGWKGHILPFDLVQEKYLKDKLDVLKSLENNIEEEISKYQEVLDNFDEDQKDKDYIKEGESFDWAKVKTVLKKKDEDEEILKQLKIACDANEKEKSFKKELKIKTEELHNETKNFIENLNDEQMKNLLVEKWVKPVSYGVSEIPTEVIKSLAKNCENLSKKYQITLSDVENQISETGKELAGMIDDLTGPEYDMLGLNEFKKILLDDKSLSEENDLRKIFQNEGRYFTEEERKLYKEKTSEKSEDLGVNVFDMLKDFKKKK